MVLLLADLSLTCLSATEFAEGGFPTTAGTAARRAMLLGPTWGACAFEFGGLGVAPVRGRAKLAESFGRDGKRMAPLDADVLDGPVGGLQDEPFDHVHLPGAVGFGAAVGGHAR